MRGTGAAGKKCVKEEGRKGEETPLRTAFAVVVRGSKLLSQPVPPFPFLQARTCVSCRLL